MRLIAVSQQDDTTRQLSCLMRLDETAELWNHDELGALYAHQLAAPLTVDLPLLSDVAKTTTFADVLFGASPEPVTLEAIKRFSKRRTSSGGEPVLPKAVAGVLYMCSIAAALVHAQKRITTLSDDDLRARLQLALRPSWLDEPSRELITSAIDLLERNAADETKSE